MNRGPGYVYRSGHICGVSAAWQAGGSIESFYVPLRHPDSVCFDPETVYNWIRLHYDAGIRFIFHSANYDLGWLKVEAGLDPPSLIDDTVAMSVIVDENRLSYSLDSIAKSLGIPGKDETLLREAAATFGFGSDPKSIKSNLWRLPARYVGPYAAADAEATLRIAGLLRPRLEAEGTIEAYHLEMDLVPLVLEMRRRGVRVNVAAAERARLDLIGRRDAALTELSRKLGHTVGLEEANSPRHLSKWFAAEGIIPPRTAPTAKFAEGQESFSDWMEIHPHWLPQTIIHIRQLEMCQSKFLHGFLLSYAHRGRLHSNVNSFRNDEGGTRSHRFSYSDPPLQQIYARDSTPLKAELAAVVRGCFEPEEGEIWAAHDFSQQEFRLMVHFAELRKLSKAKEAGDKYRADPKTDFHNMVAEMTRLERKKAKDTNFAKAFGAGIDKFAIMTGMSRDEAKSTMDQYDLELPFIKELSQECQRLAEQRGWIRLIDGARSHFEQWEPSYRRWDEEKIWQNSGSFADDPELAGTGPCNREIAERRIQVAGHPWKGRLRRAFCHKAMNRMIQGSGARQIKLAMRECWRAGIVPMLMMHDDLNTSVSNERTGQRILEIMRDVVKLTIPVHVDAEYGTTWGTARIIKNAQKVPVYTATWEEAMRLQLEGIYW